MELGAKEIAEYAIYAFSLLLFLASSLFLNLNIVLIALAFVSFAIAAVFRSNILSFAALFAYSAAVGTGHISFTPSNLLFFGFFSLLPFFACFRISGSKVRGTIPVEAASVLLPVFAAAFLLLFSIGPIISSEQALMPEWLLAFSLLVLLGALLAIPLLAEFWGLLTGAGQQAKAPEG